jgi:hypothetical protein
MCLAFENLIERFIRPVLEEFAIVGKPAEQRKGHRLVIRQVLVLERPWRMDGSAVPTTIY